MATHLFRITLASPPDRDQVVAEVFVGSEQIAELNTQSGHMAVEIYPRQDGSPWVLDYTQLVQTLTEANGRLVDRLGESGGR